MRKSGRYDRQLTIQLATRTRNAVGEEVVSWSNWANVWAARETQTATERFIASQPYAEVDTLWRCGWNSAIMEQLSPKNHRILYRDRVYDILGVVEIGRQAETHIPTKARTDAGGEP